MKYKFSLEKKKKRKTKQLPLLVRWDEQNGES